MLAVKKAEGIICTWNLMGTRTKPQQAQLLTIFKTSKTIVTFIVPKVCMSRAIIDTFYQDEGFELTY